MIKIGLVFTVCVEFFFLSNIVQDTFKSPYSFKLDLKVDGTFLMII